MSNLIEKIQLLDKEIRNDSIVGNSISASLYANHEKSQKMLDLLYRLHGSKNITKQGALSLVFIKLMEKCGINGHDGHFDIIKNDASK